MRKDDADLAGKVALVTGSSRGIGRAIALRLGAAGAKVAGTATTEQGAQAISDFFSSNGIDGVGLVLDVTSSQSVDSALQAVTERFGSPLILVNNAGITRDNLFVRMREVDWDQVINTNLSSAYRMARACVRSMTRSQWGRIINISSVVGSMGNAGQVNYAAAKAGMEGLTRALARELGGRQVTVNAVAPGFIDTDMTRALPEKTRAQILETIPLGRLGQADEIAAVVAFLAGRSGGYITGETLHVNGGMFMS
ncbi:MAG: 3-oxoacyl-ACP reductase FabG [Kistimonas sp.]|nr:3-oxoacyl-ACP reductase FabG [Kistimonas sp.]